VLGAGRYHDHLLTPAGFFRGCRAIDAEGLEQENGHADKNQHTRQCSVFYEADKQRIGLLMRGVVHVLVALRGINGHAFLLHRRQFASDYSKGRATGNCWIARAPYSSIAPSCWGGFMDGIIYTTLRPQAFPSPRIECIDLDRTYSRSLAKSTRNKGLMRRPMNHLNAPVCRVHQPEAAKSQPRFSVRPEAPFLRPGPHFPYAPARSGGQHWPKATAGKRREAVLRAASAAQTWGKPGGSHPSPSAQATKNPSPMLVRGSRFSMMS
jgi:hypothetical protein